MAMKKFDGILIVSDLDGTLLRDDKSVSEENIRAIEYFMSEGGKFTFVTGRIAVAVKRIYDIVKPNVPCGCANGCGIYDFEEARLLWKREISKDVLSLAEYVEKNHPSVGIEVCAADKIYFSRKNASIEKHIRNEHLLDIERHYRDVDEPFLKLLFADDDEEKLLEMIEGIKTHPDFDKFSAIRSDHEYYEVLPKGSNKGELVEKLAEILEIDIKRTVAIGDNDNDIAMLKCAGVGVAVSNASDGAKDAADYITVSNEEHAIAKIIDDIDKGIIC